MAYFDSHCHLNDSAFESDVEEVYQRAMSSGVKTLFVMGWDIPSSKKALEFARTHEGVYCGVGIHPENIGDALKEDTLEGSLNTIKELAKDPKVVAIGEIGLDYHWVKDEENHLLQKLWFINQLHLAKELDLPVSIHARDAIGDTLEILKSTALDRKGVLHCYSGSVESMKEFAKLGYYFGFDGPITYKNSIEPKECVAKCPIDRILIETDSPYLSPVPYRGKRNEPSYVVEVARQIALLRGLNETEVQRILEDNLNRLFRVKHG